MASPPDLPVLIWDEITRLLQNKDLLALSSTCKSFQYHANRALYRNANKVCAQPILHGQQSKRHKLLENSLSMNPQNAMHLRTLTAYSFQSFFEVWTKVPLSLDRLILPELQKWFRRPGYDCLEKVLSTQHPFTSIRELDVLETASLRPVGFGPSRAYTVLPRLLHRFRDLRKFTITLGKRTTPRIPDVASLIAEIDCPNLEHLIIQASVRLELACVSDNLLNLKFFEILPQVMPKRDENPSAKHGHSVQQDRWILNNLRERSIYFRYGTVPHTLAPILNFISSSKEDREPLVRWILESENHLQLDVNQHAGCVIDLRGLQSQFYKIVLHILGQSRFKNRTRLVISLSNSFDLSSVPELLIANPPLVDVVVPRYCPSQVVLASILRFQSNPSLFYRYFFLHNVSIDFHRDRFKSLSSFDHVLIGIAATEETSGHLSAVKVNCEGDCFMTAFTDDQLEPWILLPSELKDRVYRLFN